MVNRDKLKVMNGYIFLKNENNVKSLISNLSQLGLEFVSNDKGYRKEELSFRWKWEERSSVHLIWNREFVNDGINEQDDNLEIRSAILPHFELNIGNLLGRRLSEKLDDKIESEILTWIIELKKKI